MYDGARFQWNILPPFSILDAEDMGGFPRILQKLLFDRGIVSRNEATAFLNQCGTLYDPFLMDGMETAVELICGAVDASQKIVIYGDYDVDGVTSTAILTQVITALGGNVSGFIPNRFEEGYGLNPEAVQTLHAEDVGLIITVDCGIRSTDEAALARELGLRMIISDHHEPGSVLPNSDVVLCPRKPGDNYPEKNLAGCGIAYKIVEALLEKCPAAGIEADNWLDLAAIGTIADIVPLLGENRSIVKGGLNLLRSKPRPCIIALSQTGGFKINEINAGTIGYKIGPRLNAAGRMETAKLSYDLLLCETLDAALPFARKLEEQNRQRQQLTQFAQNHAAADVSPDDVPMVIVSRDRAFNMGVVGLAASRLTETFYRPSVVGSFGEEFTRASCRSIPEFSIIEALDACQDLLVKYGGHTMAAGLTIRNENWDALNLRLNDIASEKLSGCVLRPSCTADMEILPEYINQEALNQIGMLEPTGQQNPAPLFLVRNLLVQGARQIGAEKTHLRLSLASASGLEFTGLAFSKGDWLEGLPQRIDVLCAFEKNTWQNRETIQLIITDIRAAE